MNNFSNIQNSIYKVKIHSQQLKDEICSIDEKDATSSFYVNNLKKLSLQTLDLFNAMEKQVNLLGNYKKFSEAEKARKEKANKRRNHGIPME